jgi:hypothetical protein
MGAAAVPMLLGSAIGGLTNRKNPLQGALMGGMLGGAGGAFMSGAGGLSSLLPSMGSAATPTASSLLAAAPTAAAPTVAGFTSQAVTPAMSTIFANPTSAIGSSAIGGGPTTGLINSSIAPSFMESMGQGFQGIGNYAQQNPNLTRMGMQSAQQMMQQPEAQFAPAGQIQRGGIQDVQIASALPQAPRISLI